MKVLLEQLGVVILSFYFVVFLICADDTVVFELSRTKVKSASVSEHQQGSKIVVEVQLNEVYCKYFSDLTKKHIGKRLAIVFNGKTLISPVVKGKIDSGNIQIDGWVSEEEAKDFVNKLLVE